MKYVGIVIDAWCFGVEPERKLQFMKWGAELRAEREPALKAEAFSCYESTTPSWMKGHVGD